MGGVWCLKRSGRKKAGWRRILKYRKVQALQTLCSAIESTVHMTSSSEHQQPSRLFRNITFLFCPVVKPCCVSFSSWLPGSSLSAGFLILFCAPEQSHVAPFTHRSWVSLSVAAKYNKHSILRHMPFISQFVTGVWALQQGFSQGTGRGWGLIWFDWGRICLQVQRGCWQNSVLYRYRQKPQFLAWCQLGFYLSGYSPQFGSLLKSGKGGVPLQDGCYHLA